MDEKNRSRAADLVEAMTLYIGAMRSLDKQYLQAKADIEEMFRARMRGIGDEARSNSPVP